MALDDFLLEAEDKMIKTEQVVVNDNRSPAGTLRDGVLTIRLEVREADWRPDRVDFFVDDEHVRAVEQAPDYPMQMMIGVFDFPERPAAAGHAGHVPLFVLDYVREA